MTSRNKLIRLGTVAFLLGIAACIVLLRTLTQLTGSQLFDDVLRFAALAEAAYALGASAFLAWRYLKEFEAKVQGVIPRKILALFIGTYSAMLVMISELLIDRIKIGLPLSLRTAGAVVVFALSDYCLAHMLWAKTHLTKEN